MRNTVSIITAVLIGALALLGVMVIAGRNGRNTELSAMLPSAVEEAVDTALVKKQYNIADEAELAADVSESVAQAVDSDGDITVEVIGSDLEKGVLSVRVTADFKHPDGKDGSVSHERTVVLERPGTPEQVLCEVSFYEERGGERHKKVFVKEGELLAEPLPPVMDGKTFVCWEDESGAPADFTQPVTADAVYYAKWK